MNWEGQQHAGSKGLGVEGHNGMNRELEGNPPNPAYPRNYTNYTYNYSYTW